MNYKKLLTIGECMVEMAPDGHGKYAMNFAGDTFNTAWYAQRCLAAHSDYSVGYLTRVGTDKTSQKLMGFLADANIKTDTITPVSDRTVGLYMIELDNGERSFSYWRDTSAAKLLAADPDLLDRAFTGDQILLFSGITLAILSPEHRQNLLESLAKARAAGSQVVFDTNIRPRLWENSAATKTWLAKAAQIADVMLPSFDEEEDMFGDKKPQDTAQRYRDLGAHTVIVKNGAHEMYAWAKGEGGMSISPERVSPVDSTAAGDSFNAGYITARMLGANLEDSLRSGMTLSANVVQHRGALVRL
ncbi:2-keto-3-deoxygluconate kinase [Pacificibacter maritimus]|uniref:2-keto-3-deoxygluconate kinase n=1 Tax=Pacificibacter maritimus TaxID=762213 RepID=A0A3N4USK3_9RHOB|nr:sugar kinase [Pacificibacter maritimus]RPE71675.1 2-keto-3-deoxygluconate kinase [Pacificibacter maritimus]